MNEISFLEKIKSNPHPSFIDYYGYYITLDTRNPNNVIKTGFIQMEKGVTSLENFIKKVS